MSENFKIDSLKYHIMIEWPPMCRNRSPQTLKDRPDLVYKINEHTNRIIDICKNYKNPIKIDKNYNMTGLRTWWQDGPELYHFLMTQEQNKLKVIPELAVVNQLTSRLMMFRFQSNKDGIFVY